MVGCPGSADPARGQTATGTPGDGTHGPRARRHPDGFPCTWTAGKIQSPTFLREASGDAFPSRVSLFGFTRGSLWRDSSLCQFLLHPPPTCRREGVLSALHFQTLKTQRKPLAASPCLGGNCHVQTSCLSPKIFNSQSRVRCAVYAPVPFSALAKHRRSNSGGAPGRPRVCLLERPWLSGSPDPARRHDFPATTPSCVILPACSHGRWRQKGHPTPGPWTGCVRGGFSDLVPPVHVLVHGTCACWAPVTCRELGKDPEIKLGAVTVLEPLAVSCGRRSGCINGRSHREGLRCGPGRYFWTARRTCLGGGGGPYRAASKPKPEGTGW